MWTASMDGELKGGPTGNVWAQSYVKSRVFIYTISSALHGGTLNTALITQSGMDMSYNGTVLPITFPVEAPNWNTLLAIYTTPSNHTYSDSWSAAGQHTMLANTATIIATVSYTLAQPGMDYARAKSIMQSFWIKK